MIDDFNQLLRTLMKAQVDTIRSDGQVGFQPPDDAWRSYVSNLTDDNGPVNALNVYMVDMRENRKLRSNERMQEVRQNDVLEIPPPQRIDCHYLVTAWSPATGSEALEPTLDELALLYDAAAALMNMEPLALRDLYTPLPAWIPEALADLPIPLQVLPVEGFPKLAEFWGSMGAGQPWKPAVYFVATLPVIRTKTIISPMVTTLISEYRFDGSPGPGEVLIQIGGTVTDRSGNPIHNAWVALENRSGERLKRPVRTNDLGRFAFDRLHAGEYRLRVRAVGYGEPPPRPITVPSPSGEYDVVVA